jgi:hypothetical protein
MKTLFVAAGPIEWGSSRMRCYWPATYMDGAVVTTWNELAKMGGAPASFDAYVFQKRVDAKVNRALLERGKQVWWDVCDPSWWFQPGECREIAETVTGVVGSSRGLADDYAHWNGMSCELIPDRLELGHFPLARTHTDAKPVKFIWFGVSVNRFVVMGELANLERLKANGYDIALTIFDNQPDVELFRPGFPVNYVRWSLDQENEVLAGHDIALLPPYPGPWGAVKSNNKKLTAWASGLPVASAMSYADLCDLVTDRELRAKCAGEGLASVRRDYRVEESAREWDTLLRR